MARETPRGRVRDGVRQRAGTIAALVALALVVAGGSAYAVTELGTNSVKSKHIAPNAVTNKQTRNMTVVAPRNVRAFAGVEANAPAITLIRRGPFRIFVKCFTLGAGTQARAYFGNQRAGAIGQIGGTAYEGYGATAYLQKSPGTLLSPSASVPENAAAKFDWSVMAISGKASINTTVTAFLKGGTLPAGNGTYGSGKRCIFTAGETGTG